MATRFYIYFHINPLKNEVFYVGKGSGRRAYKKYDRSELWNNIVNKYGLIVNIIEEGITNKEALELEKFYINKIGRRDLELGPLVNHTDGGENPPIRYGNKNRLGSKQTEEWKKNKSNISKEMWLNRSEEDKKEIMNKIVKTRMNNNYIHSEETRKKIGKGAEIKVDQFDKKGCYIKTFNSIKEAENLMGVYHISRVCNNKRKTSGGFVWKFSDVKGGNLSQ